MEIKKLFDEQVLDGKYFDVHQDWEKPIPGFFILASKRKIKSVGEFTDEESVEFITMLVKVRKAMKKVLGIQYIDLLQREDSPYWDFHICLFPKYPWMAEKFGRATGPEVWKYAQKNFSDDKSINEVKVAAKKVREYLAS